MLIFKKIRWKNFLSTGNSFIELYLDKYNTTLVSGDNGAGKSTMLDALTYSLFGKSFRGININKLVNTVNEKDCVVEVEFSTNNHNYMIKRGLRPKIFEIYKDGNMMPQNATVKDYQNILEDQILKMSYKAFCQVVMLGSSNYIPFMKLSTKDRKVIVEDLLDINIFSIMNSILKARISENKDKISIVINKINVLESKIDGYNKIVSRMEERSKKSVNTYLEEIEKTNSQIKSLYEEIGVHKEEIESFLKSIEDKDTVFDKLSRAENIEDQLKLKLKKIDKNILFYEDNNNCPTCGQDVAENHKVKEIFKEKESQKKIKDAIELICDTIKSIEDRTSLINKTLNKVENIEAKISSKNNTMFACNKYANKMKDSIEEVSKDREELDSEMGMIEKLTIEYDDFDKRREDLISDRSDLEVVSNLLKDTGIKSGITTYYLPIMNKMINQYLASMNFFCQFVLDESFNETIKSRYRDDFTYYNFSEGERLRIDLSLLLAWREIARLKNSVNCNLLLLDEIFDSSLDAVGTEEFLKILESFGEKANVFVITHKSDQLIDKFENNLHFIKKGNFSSITFKLHKSDE